MAMTGAELRNAYLDYFAGLPDGAHRVVPSAPLVPPDDPTLLFTSAGMVQFKALYSGTVDPLPYTRAASCQKCLRAGGKGSDLENVGRTLRHHTFFEMLGNFSFGDYFKRETIRWAWRFVTEHMHLPPERLFPTIFRDDDEAERLWKEETGCHYTPVRLDEKENFWGPAGDTGACGPCSELCFFMGSDEELAEIRAQLAKSEDAYMPVLAQRIVEEGDLFLEIWNMVFPQFDQQPDGSRPPLKNRGIDTGAGLERMTTAMLWMEGKAGTPYETDLLSPIVQAASGLLGVDYIPVLAPGANSEKATRERLAVNAIADHARALVFCLAEGMAPGNVGRGYVLRRIQRRALRFSSLLGKDEAFMDQLVDPVLDAMGDAYPDLKRNPDFLRRVLRSEEESFLRTRNRGMKLLDELIDAARESEAKTIPGAEAFKLWDTYGFPVDMTREIAAEEGLRVDGEGYDAALQAQRERGKASWQGAELNKNAERAEEFGEQHGPTEFAGYESTERADCRVAALIADGAFADRIDAGTKACVILDATPFYAEAGGQVGDTGVLLGEGDIQFEVLDTQKSANGAIFHYGELLGGSLAVGSPVRARVDARRRLAIRRNHTCVHLLQSALKRIVGDHVTQAGSFVGPEGARFDFSNPEGLDLATLRRVQEEVNRMIIEDYPVTTEVMPLEEARQRGAIAPFGEKYGATVRVVQVGHGGADGYPSIEFCGGTHLAGTGQAGRFRILSEGSISSGVRRIEAAAGEPALRHELDDQYGVVLPLQNALAGKGAALLDRVEQLSSRIKQLEKELARERQKAALSRVDEFAASAAPIDGARVAAALLEDVDGGDLRTFAVNLQKKLGPGGVAIAVSRGGGKTGIVVASGEEARGRYPAGKVLAAVAQPLGGKGGGKPDVAQGGAKDAPNAEEVLAGAAALVAGVAG